MRSPTFLLACVLTHSVITPSTRGQLVQIRQNFSSDPGWDHHQNRIVGTEMPRVIQDFGWRRTNFTGSGPGEIGGRVENSRRQAYYALPLGKPLTFADEISASGKLALRQIGLRGVGYVGFFNSRRVAVQGPVRLLERPWRRWERARASVGHRDEPGRTESGPPAR
jgi:hypothetical protein